jgi:Leucine-rich repeat (LRR) protein
MLKKRKMRFIEFFMLIVLCLVFITPLSIAEEDITPPEVMSIEVSPDTIDISDGGKTITVIAEATDDISGIEYFIVGATSPTGIHSYHSSNLVNTSGNLYSGEILIEEMSEAGTWEVSVTAIWDSMNNDRNYSREELLNLGLIRTIEVINGETPVLSAPDKIKVTPYENSIMIDWTEVTGATSYDIEVDSQFIENTTSTMFVHDNLETLSEHEYRVRSRYGNDYSEWTTYIIISTLDLSKTVVYFRDRNLEDAIRDRIGKYEGDIYYSDVNQIYSLDLYDKNISDLEGIQFVDGLGNLDIGKNNISDISFLSSLTSLRMLSADINQISDISPISHLVNLDYLDLNTNNIENIDGLNTLTKLRSLCIFNNNIQDISSLSDLISIENLSIHINSINDFKPLENLYNLKNINLGNNTSNDYSSTINYYNNLTSRDFYLIAGQVFSPDGTLFYPTENTSVNINLTENYGKHILKSSTVLRENGTYILSQSRQVIDHHELFASSHKKENPYADSAWLPLDITPAVTDGPLMYYNLSLQEPVIKGFLLVTGENAPFIRTEESYFDIKILSMKDKEIIVETEVKEDGSYLLGGVPNGDYLMYAHQRGLKNEHSSSELITIHIKEGEVLIQDLYVNRLNRIEGQVFKPDGTNIDSNMDVVVELWAYDKAYYKETEMNVNESGYFSFSGLQNSSYHIVAKVVVPQNQYSSSLTKLVDFSEGNHIEVELLLSEFNNQLVEFNDINFENVVRNIINKPSGDVYIGDMNYISSLSAENNSIVSVEGIQYMNNLLCLNLSNNLIEDISKIDSCVNLEVLYLDNMKLNQIDFLEVLTNLHRLHIDNNDISDITVLQNLDKMMVLKFNNNNVTDINPLANLTSLVALEIGANNIVNIDVLVNMTSLFYLDLRYNQINSFESIRNLYTLTHLYLYGNNTNDYSPTEGYYEKLTHKDFILETGTGEVITFPDGNLEVAIREIINLPTGDITDNHVNMITDLNINDRKVSDLTGLEYFISLRDLRFDNNNVSSLEPLRGLDLINIFGANNNISDLSSLEDMTNLIGIAFAENQITDISVLDNFINLGWFWMPHNNISSLPEFTNNKNLGGFGLGSNAISDISNVGNIPNIGWLHLNNNNIEDITPLLNCQLLNNLNLGYNQITDISVLSNLNNLENLNLERNFLGTIDDISNLTNLKDLNIDDTGIFTIAPLSNLINLEILDISHNDVSDLSVISNFTGLKELLLGKNSVVDISPLSNLTNLVYLDINTNQVDDISYLKNLINIEYLDCGRLKTNDISVLSNLINLKHLNIGESNINSINSLEELVQLESLYINDNNISDFEPLRNLVNLTTLYLSGNNTVDYSPTEAYYNNLIDKDFVLTVEVIAFPDANLEAAIREIINLPTGDITENHVNNIDILHLEDKGISDLEGIQYFTSLEWLHLDKNNISDVYPLVNMNLPHILLNSNNLSDLTSIGMMNDNLISLELSNNNITDISPLANLNPTKFLFLKLDNNNITDISPISSLYSLISLDIHKNFEVTNASLVSNLNNLRYLRIDGTGTTNVDFLSGMIKLDFLDISHNSIIDISSLSNLVNLEKLYIYNNNISDFEPLRNLVNLTTLYLSGNNTFDYSPVEGYYGNLIDKDFTIITGTGEVIAFPDANLEAAIREIINLPTGDITDNHVNMITDLNLNERNISDLTGLEYFISLRDLRFDNNNVSSLEPLRGLDLINIFGANNNISDLSSLEDMTNLIGIAFAENQITDISVLDNFINLGWFWMPHNNISSLPEFTNNKNLGGFGLGNNDISDISNVGNITNIGWLHLNNNNIEDITPLSNCQLLNSLSLGYNQITDISVLSNLNSLEKLNIEGNFIGTIDDISNLTNLKGLNISDTGINTIDQLSNFIKLESLNIYNNNISDFEPLRNLVNLIGLHLTGNKTSDFSPVEAYYNNLIKKDFTYVVVSEGTAVTAMDDSGIINLEFDEITTGGGVSITSMTKPNDDSYFYIDPELMYFDISTEISFKEEVLITVNYDIKDLLSNFEGEESELRLYQFKNGVPIDITLDEPNNPDTVNHVIKGIITDHFCTFAIGVPSDQTPPKIILNHEIKEEYTTEEVLVIDVSVNDELSGIKDFYIMLNDELIDNNQEISLKDNIGLNNIIIEATDNAGNIETLQIDFEVLITADIKISPDKLNIKSKGKSINVKLSIPDGYQASDIDTNSVVLKINGEIIKGTIRNSPNKGKGKSELIIEFNRNDIIEAIGNQKGEVLCELHCSLNNGNKIIGFDYIKVKK